MGAMKNFVFGIYEDLCAELSDEGLENLTEEQLWAMVEEWATYRIANIADIRPN